ncbi:hypothetical protein RI129_002961 [Pyrocoelia pectoralis]|uniref:Helix-turn-helix domain-containing protein n=1 Tax=Pyrocoelia pectoralis TaxID=417401 RepID=A0AAN7VMP9_9COLE
MDFIIDQVKRLLPFQFSFIFKYVDDIICGLPANQVDNALITFNSIHYKLQFTVEREDNNGVPFLDTKLIRTSDNKIFIDWYTKPTHSGRYINFNSNHIMRQKVNTLKGMKNRVLKISHVTFQQKNLKRLSTMFITNNFPRSLVNNILFNNNCNLYYRHIQLATTIATQQPAAVSTPRYSRLPYIPDITHQLTNILRHADTKFAFYNPSPLNQLFTKLKDKTPTLLQSGVIYNVPCMTCNKVYIGLTNCWLKSRLSTHRSDIKTKKTRCALANHVLNLGHQFDFDNVSILNRSNNRTTLRLMEMVEINKYLKQSLNFRSDVDNLHVIYANLLAMHNSTNSN